MSRPSDAVSLLPLHHALAALLGPPEVATLPYEWALAATIEPQAALERAWRACVDPWRMRRACFELNQRDLDERVRCAWIEAGDVAHRQAADAIRATVPCPVLSEAAP